jgi:thiol-disulfide isomerase/thioredoxin
MKKNFGWILIAVLLVALIGGASVLYNQLGESYQMDQLATQAPPVEAEGTIPMQKETEPESMTAPDFMVVDQEGNEVHLSDYFGKPIVLNFWASWCGPCRSEMPDFDEKYQELGDQVQFLMVNMTDGSRETLEIAKAFVADSGFTFPVFYDVYYQAAVTYGVSSLPTTYFIDADGTLVAYSMGAINADTLQRGIDMIYRK